MLLYFPIQASNVNVDPFSVIQHIENSVKSRSHRQSEQHLKQQKIQQQIEELQHQLEQQKEEEPCADGESECKFKEEENVQNQEKLAKAKRDLQESQGNRLRDSKPLLKRVKR